MMIQVPSRVSRLRLLPLAWMMAGACASAPLPPPTIPYEKKIGWILALEDQRILRDATLDPAPPVLPPPRKGQPAVVLPTPDLVKLLTDTDARIRRRAAIGIGRVGLHEGLTPLQATLTDADAEVRQAAAFALGLLAQKEAVPALTKTLAEDASPLVRGRAAEALGLIGDAAAAPAIGALVAQAMSAGVANAIPPDDLSYPLAPEVEAFRLGLFALTRLKAHDQLAAAVLDANGQPKIRWWPVAYALQRTGDKRALPALTTFVRGADVYGAAFGARGLGALKDPSSVAVLQPLLLKKDLNPRVLARVVEAAGALGDPALAPPLLTLLDTPQLDPNIRLAVVVALGQVKSPASTDRLMDLIGDPWPTLRAAALRSLAAINPETAVAVLSGMDADQDWTVRAAIASALSTVGQGDVVTALVGMLKDSDKRTLPAVLRALARVNAPTLDAILLEHLKTDDVSVRAAAASLIGERKTANGPPALKAAWTVAQADASENARGAILDALLVFGPNEAREALTAALKDKDFGLRLKAAAMLKPIAPDVDVAAAVRPAPVRVERAVYETLASPRYSPHVFLDTAKGSIEIELSVLDAPLTAHNFITLARKGYFNGLRVHRVVSDFVVQDGDPRGDGEGGPGHSIRDELNDLPYLRGTVGMALSGPDTGGSQYFLTISPQPHLDAKYTVFGRVVKGLELLEKIQQWDTVQNVRVWDGVQMGRSAGQ